MPTPPPTKPTLRALLLAELERQGISNAELSQRIAAARVPPADPRIVEATVGRALGRQPRRIAEGLLFEVCEAIDVDVVLRPRRGW